MGVFDYDKFNNSLINMDFIGAKNMLKRTKFKDPLVQAQAYSQAQRLDDAYKRYTGLLNHVNGNNTDEIAAIQYVILKELGIHNPINKFSNKLIKNLNSYGGRDANYIKIRFNDTTKDDYEEGETTSTDKWLANMGVTRNNSPYKIQSDNDGEYIYVNKNAADLEQVISALPLKTRNWVSHITHRIGKENNFLNYIGNIVGETTAAAGAGGATGAGLGALFGGVGAAPGAAAGAQIAGMMGALHSSFSPIIDAAEDWSEGDREQYINAELIPVQVDKKGNIIQEFESDDNFAENYLATMKNPEAIVNNIKKRINYDDSNVYTVVSNAYTCIDEEVLEEQRNQGRIQNDEYYRRKQEIRDNAYTLLHQANLDNYEVWSNFDTEDRYLTVADKRTRLSLQNVINRLNDKDIIISAGRRGKDLGTWITFKNTSSDDKTYLGSPDSKSKGFDDTEIRVFVKDLYKSPTTDAYKQRTEVKALNDYFGALEGGYSIDLPFLGQGCKIKSIKQVKDPEGNTNELITYTDIDGKDRAISKEEAFAALQFQYVGDSNIDYLRSILSDTNGNIRQLTKQENDALKAQYLGEVYGILGTGINPEIGALYQNLLYNYSMRNYLNY